MQSTKTQALRAARCGADGQCRACINVRTCLTACFFPVAWIPRRFSPAWRGSIRHRCAQLHRRLSRHRRRMTKARQQAQTVAIGRGSGPRHRHRCDGDGDFWTYLPEIAAALDDPVADYAALPTFLLAEEAAKGLKVVLTGEGGDELFAGYGRYRSAIRPRWLGGRAMRSRGIPRRSRRAARRPRDWRARVRRRLNCRVSRMRVKERCLQEAQQALDCADWLPNDLLIKLDRTLMAHGLEGRTPFLDSGVADFRLSITRRPEEIRGGHGQISFAPLSSQRALPRQRTPSPKSAASPCRWRNG